MKERENAPFIKVIYQKDRIIERLKEKGCRITSQRQLVIDTILKNECSCCKEIYYKALKKDPLISIATVYR
ncbi:Fur family transcriptional regulator, partial [bacterium 1XD42-8]